MCPNDDISGGRPLDERADAAGTGNLSDTAVPRSQISVSTPFWSSGTGARSDIARRQSSGPARLASRAGGGVPGGHAALTIQLAHALELLSGPVRPAPPEEENRCPQQGPAAQEELRMADGRPTVGHPRGPGLFQSRAGQCDDDVGRARQLIADALVSVAGSAGLSVPVSALVQAPAPEEVDSELEAAFVEFDMAREAWRALPGSAETSETRPEVDRYFAAEDAVLAIADGRGAVLRRQADLLLDMTDELSDQMGPSAANAIANVAQGLLLRLRR